MLTLTRDKSHILKMKSKFRVVKHDQLAKDPQVLCHDVGIVLEEEVVDVLPDEGLERGVRQGLVTRV